MGAAAGLAVAVRRIGEDTGRHGATIRRLTCHLALPWGRPVAGVLCPLGAGGVLDGVGGLQLLQAAYACGCDPRACGGGAGAPDQAEPQEGCS